MVFFVMVEVELYYVDMSRILRIEIVDASAINIWDDMIVAKGLEMWQSWNYCGSFAAVAREARLYFVLIKMIVIWIKILMKCY